MSNHPTPNLRPLAPGIILSLLSIAFGFLLGGTLLSALRQLVTPPAISV